MRSKQQILMNEGELLDKVWYNRSLVLLEKVLEGREEMPPEDIMDGAGNGRAKVEKKYGVENLGPYSDFEWGMINGKLSALRWVMGDDWDMLDT